MARPHDTPTGPNESIRNLRVDVLSDGWFTLRRATFEQQSPDGSWTRRIARPYDRGNGAVALLRDPARDTVLLVRQYRLPAHLNDHPDGMLIEAPAGLLDDGEDAEQALRRELEEEVGHRVESLQRIFRLYMSPGSVTEHLTFFAGAYSTATSAGSGGGQHADGEFLDLVEVTLDEAIAMVDDGRICDAKTVHPSGLGPPQPVTAFAGVATCALGVEFSPRARSMARGSSRAAACRGANRDDGSICRARQRWGSARSALPSGAGGRRSRAARPAARWRPSGRRPSRMMRR